MEEPLTRALLRVEEEKRRRQMARASWADMEQQPTASTFDNNKRISSDREMCLPSCPQIGAIPGCSSLLLPPISRAAPLSRAYLLDGTGNVEYRICRIGKAPWARYPPLPHVVTSRAPRHRDANRGPKVKQANNMAAKYDVWWRRSILTRPFMESDPRSLRVLPNYAFPTHPLHTGSSLRTGSLMPVFHVFLGLSRCPCFTRWAPLLSTTTLFTGSSLSRIHTSACLLRHIRCALLRRVAPPVSRPLLPLHNGVLSFGTGVQRS